MIKEGIWKILLRNDRLQKSRVQRFKKQLERLNNSLGATRHKTFLTSSDILCADMSLFGMNQHSHVSQCIIVVETTIIVYLL